MIATALTRPRERMRLLAMGILREGSVEGLYALFYAAKSNGR
jgi:hypothetical protein